jgi:hypothetical protein
VAEGFTLTGGQFNDPEHRWVYYIDADPVLKHFRRPLWTWKLFTKQRASPPQIYHLHLNNEASGIEEGQYPPPVPLDHCSVNPARTRT